MENTKSILGHLKNHSVSGLPAATRPFFAVSTISCSMRFFGRGRVDRRGSRGSTSSGRITGRVRGSLINSRSSFIVNAACSGPRLPTMCTRFTLLRERVSNAYGVMSVLWNCAEQGVNLMISSLEQLNDLRSISKRAPVVVQCLIVFQFSLLNAHALRKRFSTQLEHRS